MKSLYEAVDRNFKRHLEVIQSYLRQPSISADGTGMDETARLTVEAIKSLGASDVHLAETSGYPVAYGELITDPSKRTVLVYSMYDVQPVEPEKWVVDPFGGEIMEFEDMGRCLVCRGIVNTKGPLMAFFNAIRTIIEEERELPVNLIFAIEGEEELGSPHLPEFVQEYAEKLRRADVVYFPGFSEDRTGKVRMSLGVKGILYLKLRSRGGSWGGPRGRHIHSSNHSWVESPVWKLVWALFEMRGADGRIRIPGFYDDIAQPSEEDEKLIQRLLRTFDENTIKKELDVERFTKNRTGEGLLREYLYSTTLNIDGLEAGYTGPGTKTILPCEARGYLDVRLVPNQEPRKQLKLLTDFISKRFPMIKIEVCDMYPSAKTSIREPGVQALIRTYRSFGKEPEIWPIAAGSAPFYLFTRNLGLPFVIGGLGHGSRAHSPNEYAVVDGPVGGIRQYEKSVVTFLYELSK